MIKQIVRNDFSKSKPEKILHHKAENCTGSEANLTMILKIVFLILELYSTVKTGNFSSYPLYSFNVT